jgi:hypothetical protein
VLDDNELILLRWLLADDELEDVGPTMMLELLEDNAVELLEDAGSTIMPA